MRSSTGPSRSRARVWAHFVHVAHLADPLEQTHLVLAHLLVIALLVRSAPRAPLEPNGALAPAEHLRAAPSDDPRLGEPVVERRRGGLVAASGDERRRDDAADLERRIGPARAVGRRVRRLGRRVRDERAEESEEDGEGEQSQRPAGWAARASCAVARALIELLLPEDDAAVAAHARRPAHDLAERDAGHAHDHVDADLPCEAHEPFCAASVDERRDPPPDPARSGALLHDAREREEERRNEDGGVAVVRAAGEGGCAEDEGDEWGERGDEGEERDGEEGVEGGGERRAG